MGRGSTSRRMNAILRAHGVGRGRGEVAVVDRARINRTRFHSISRVVGKERKKKKEKMNE